MEEDFNEKDQSQSIDQNTSEDSQASLEDQDDLKEEEISQSKDPKDDKEKNFNRFKEKIVKAMQEYAGGEVEVEIAPQSSLAVHLNMPLHLPLLCVVGRPLFPEALIPLTISSDQDKKTVDKAMESTHMIGVVLVKENLKEVNFLTRDMIYNIGVSARIIKKINLPEGGYHILISTISRFLIESVNMKKFPSIAKVSYPQVISADTEDLKVKALERNIIEKVKQITENNNHLSQEIRINMANISDLGKLADFAATAVIVKREEQQEILETFDITERLEKVLLFLTKEFELVQIQKKISETMTSKIEKQQKEFYLREELKAIKQELGISDKSSEYDRFYEKIAQLGLQGEVADTVKTELEKFSFLDPMSSEYMVTRNYLDTIISLPWQDPKPDKFSLKKAQRILDEDHYGMEEVKTRIIEYLSVRKLKKNSKGAIICLVGPPGVGKTSIGKSIAKSLDRPFFRFSVGGVRDEAEIKGHRRTYVGAMPGKLIQGLKIVKTKSPVFMIDEIDKINASHYGDPFSALLEALDPAQNSQFRDHYLDLPFDLSSILFIATANNLEGMPRPLLDRFEIIELSGYIDEEKIAIAKKYLIPKVLNSCGLTSQDINFHSSALKMIAERYAREAGMRRFEKSLERIGRKVAFNILERNDSLPYIINKNNLMTYLDEPTYPKEELVKTPFPGMAMGLAWTSAGGATLVIEAIAIPSTSGGFSLTGNLGSVMKESANLAYSYVRMIADKFDISSEFFEKNHIHLHIPEGATPKDGPSAGITMASALLSLARKKRIRDSLAMTGELSLTGRVMAIGGLREKVIAAKRNGIKVILFPKANEKDLEKIPEHVKKGITFKAMSVMGDVIKEIFKDASDK